MSDDLAELEIMRGMGFFMMPIYWPKIMSEETLFLAFLVDWSLHAVAPQDLERNEGWFYCPVKVVEEQMNWMGEKPQYRLVNALVKRGFLSKETRGAVRRLQGGGVRPSKQRWFRIDYKALRLACEARRKELAERKAARSKAYHCDQ